MLVKKHLKYILTVALLLSVLLFNGCANGDFEAVLPPVNAFPTPRGYEFVEVITDSFVVEKSVRGNKTDFGLQAKVDPMTVKDFSSNEKGYVIYDVNGNIYKLEASITMFPNSSSSVFLASHDPVSTKTIPSNWPGRFNVVIYEQQNCLLITKKAVSILDGEGTAIVYVVNEDGTLAEKSIKVGHSNDTYYQILEGLSAGDKVVVK